MIKHKANANAKTAAEQEWYLCNGVVKPNPDKLVYRWDKVTCKNCLKIRRKANKKKEEITAMLLKDIEERMKNKDNIICEIKGEMKGGRDY